MKLNALQSSNKNNYFFHWFLILIFTALLSACQTPTPLHPKHPLSTATTWSATGKLGFRTPQAQGSVHFSWIATPSHYQVMLTDIFGLLIAKIEGSWQQASLLTRDGQVRTGAPDELLFDTLGVEFPLPALNFWLRGLQTPNFPTHSVSSDQFEQLGWHIQYLEWDIPTHHPKKLQLINSMSQTQVTIFLNWQITPEK